MKKTFYIFIVCILLVFVQSVSAQDYQATIQYLQSQIELMSLQATVSALQNQSSTTNQGSGTSYDMMNWGQQNSSYASTPTPFSYDPTYGTAVTMQTFPADARPLIPASAPPVWNTPKSNFYTEVTVGKNGQYTTIAEACKNLPTRAGEVVIKLISDTSEPQSGISVPIDKNITSFRITSDNEYAVRTVLPADRSIWFFCNGIPVIIDKNVEFGKMSMIIGGTVTYAGHDVQVPQSTIIINGKAYWVYAGGQSDRDGQSSTVNEALVIVNGEAERVYGGGRAIYGETIVNHATIVVNGMADELYCSGYTEYPNAKATVGRSDMLVYGWYGRYGLGLGQGEITLQNSYGCY